MGRIKNGIIGLAIGDALGVPVEFISREELNASPVMDMIAFGTHDQPLGTWSDDTSLTLCMCEALLEGFDLTRIAKNFIFWKYGMFWTPHGSVFDIGIQTSKSIDKLSKVIQSEQLEDLRLLRYEADEFSNGNGSLMRILPLYFYLKGSSVEGDFQLIWEVSALTHGHIRSALACMFYLMMVDELVLGNTKTESYVKAKERMNVFFEVRDIAEREIRVFDRIVLNDIRDLERKEIQSSGYVIHSLEAALWCFLKTDSFKECVLKAVNLGEDTDTVGAIAGGLAGVYYGERNIPKKWMDNLVKIDQIKALCGQLEAYWS
ncbi:ADP-ribosylglycohydrolase family protein [Flagellimonas sp. DF-77]|uniref:ADP-ribosylglycohydrolase family protein n=1 Tax=Flagellimonas algarum TaxID=3230298 RepID=UPI003399FF81